VADAVVGTLRALLTMDTASFEVGAKKATTAANNLDKSITELGKETARLAPQAERMVKAFGGDKLLATANNMTAAVNKFGGVARLTATEQERINRTVTQAIEKYRVLGQVAPKAMVDLERATRGANTAATGFRASMGQANSILATFGVTLGVGTLTAFARELLTTADALVKVADRTGLTTTEVQRLEFIARQSGNSIDELTGAIGQMQNRLVSGDKSAVAAVKFLGVNLKELKDASPFEQMSTLATAIAKVPDPATRAAIAMDLFGRTGIAIMPTLISDFKALGDEAPVMADHVVRSLDQAGDALDKAQMQIKVWAANSFNFIGRLFDQTNMWFRRGVAVFFDAMASLVSMASKIPGMGTLFDKVGISVKGLRQEAQWFRDAANATQFRLNNLDVEVRKNTGSMVDYEGALAGGTKGLSAQGKAAEDAGKAHRAFVNYLGEREIEDAALAMKALTEATIEQERADRSYRAFLNQIGEQEIRDEEARQAERAKIIGDNEKMQRDVANETGVAIMEAEAKRMAERGALWKKFTEVAGSTFDQLNAAVAGSFAQMALGAKNFKEGFLDIWESIKAAVTRIFAEIAGSFITGMLKKMAAGIAGTAVAGAVTGTAVGAGTAAAVGGTAAAAGGTAAGGLAGLGGTAAALATNPFTIAIAAGIGGFFLGKKLFGGGEEAKEVNPRRDLFTSQFGGPQALAAKLTGLSGQPGGGALFQALRVSDTLTEFQAAEKAILAFLTNKGARGFKMFNMGGFVPPGVNQMAMLHGGMFGEDVTPRTSHSAGPSSSQHLSITIHAIDAKGVRDFVESRDFGDALERSFFHNKNFIASRVRSSLVP
jgi:hypothetical protein